MDRNEKSVQIYKKKTMKLTFIWNTNKYKQQTFKQTIKEENKNRKLTIKVPFYSSTPSSDSRNNIQKKKNLLNWNIL